MKQFNNIQEAEKYAIEYFIKHFSDYGKLQNRNNKGIIEFYSGHSPVVFQCTIFASEPIKRPVGRPKGPEKVYIGFKIEPKYHAEVKAMVKEYIRKKTTLLK
jgi:hypothetical protein